MDRLIAAEINFSSTAALRLADIEGLPSNNTIGPVNAIPLQDVRRTQVEQTREERPGRFLRRRGPTRQHEEMLKQVRAPPAHVMERAYPKQVTQEKDAERYFELSFRIDKTIFAAYCKAEMRKVKILVIASLDFVNTSPPSP